MRLNRTLVAILLTSSLPLLGCTDEVGSCDDDAQGEDTVLVNGAVQFGGQAIMNQACAGCHSSTAKGAARQGAPAGLDFDLLPIDPEDPSLVDGTKMNADRTVVVNVKPAALAGLRERRRRVFEDRNTIWQQVKEGMMPPPGSAFDGFRTLSNIIGTSDGAPCKADVGPLAPLSRKSSRDVLRKWLACSAPVVEVNSSDKVVTMPDQENIVTTDAGTGAVDAGTAWSVAGEVGYQFAVCEDTGDGGTQITIEQVFERVMGGKCALCHPSVAEPDLSTPEAAYAALVGKQSDECDKPYVVPGNAEGSFLYELVSTTPSCSMRMPPTGNLASGEIKVIADWINAGALRASEVDKARASEPLPASIGLDAGIAD